VWPCSAEENSEELVLKPIIIVNPKLLAVLTLNFASGLTLWPFIILKKRNDQVIRHEKIHIKQQEEMLIIFFYQWYLVEWFLKLFKYGLKSYKNLSFEREAYNHDQDPDYIIYRKKYTWFKYL